MTEESADGRGPDEAEAPQPLAAALDARVRPRTALWSEVALDDRDDTRATRRGAWRGRGDTRDPTSGRRTWLAPQRLLQRSGWRFRRRSGRPSRPTTAVVLGAFAIGGVAIGAFVGASRGDAPLIPEATVALPTSAPSPAPSTVPTSPTSSIDPTPSTDPAGPGAALTPDELVALLPTASAARCRPALALDARASAAVVCDLDAPTLRLELRVFAAASARNGRFAELAGAAPNGTGSPRCARGRAEVRTWSHRSVPAAVAGVYTCRLRGGVAEIVWTDDALGILGVARADGIDLAQLFEWWRTDAPGAMADSAEHSGADGP